ncbi:hypothetical protein [Desulfotomaculum sp. 1211_IL3151]|uniref:hypothetical protein n=1 Tax=Desulfotomaculum sp. 1211_IL3151 TaxID=3084055 RepID=UPI002FDADF43
MGEADVLAIQQSLNRVETVLTDLTKAVNDLRVTVARDYVTKEDFLKFQEQSEFRIVKLHEKIEDHVKEDKADRWKLAGLVATITGIVLSIIQGVIRMVRGGGGTQ